MRRFPRLVASSSGDIPKVIYVLANLSSGEGGTSSTLETVTPKAGAGSDVTVADTATPPVIKERLYDLGVEDPCATAPITVAGSMVAAERVSGVCLVEYMGMYPTQCHQCNGNHCCNNGSLFIKIGH